MDTKGQSVADVMTTDPVVLASGASLEAADLALRSTFIKGIPLAGRERRALVEKWLGEKRVTAARHDEMTR